MRKEDYAFVPIQFSLALSRDKCPREKVSNQKIFFFWISLGKRNRLVLFRASLKFGFELLLELMLISLNYFYKIGNILFESI